MSCLAVADSLTLITILVPAVTGSDVRCLQLWSDTMCGVMHYFHHVTPVLSISSLLCVTFSRVVVVVCPIWSRLHLSQTVAVIIWVVTSLIWLAVFSPYLYGVRVIQQGEPIVPSLSCTCVWKEQFASYLTILSQVRVNFLTALPIILITVGSIIILTVRKNNVVGNVNKSVTLDKALSRCLLTNNFVFIMSNMPAFVFQVLYLVRIIDNILVKNGSRDILVFLANINHSINFLLYLMSGSHFRIATKSVMRFSFSKIYPSETNT